LSRLVAIVDTYDALTTDRPYKERWTTQRAIAYMMYDSTDRYDKQLIARFASRSKLHPIGSIVRLVDGRIGVVTGGSQKSPTRPILRIIDETNGEINAGSIVDLAQTTDPSLEIDVMAQPVEALLPYIDLLTTPHHEENKLNK
ncbi:MAG: HD domain-containing phosphohydrolase, partial [Armatimonadota bacterium]